MKKYTSNDVIFIYINIYRCIWLIYIHTMYIYTSDIYTHLIYIYTYDVYNWYIWYLTSNDVIYNTHYNKVSENQGYRESSSIW